jgi:hypothetical protein
LRAKGGGLFDLARKVKKGSGKKGADLSELGLKKIY